MHPYMLQTKDCEFRYVLASGPGGQHVNKTATAVELRIPLSKLGLPVAVLKRLHAQQHGRINKGHELVVQASSHRSQLRNKDDAVRRAEKLINAAFQEPKERRATKPTISSARRRVEEKKRRGKIKNHRQRPPSEA